MTRWQYGRRAVLRTTAALAAGAGLAGCGAARVLLLDEPARLFTLTPKSTFEGPLPTVGWQLLIETPVAANALDSVRIALYDNPFEIQYFAAIAWSARAPAMVQTLLVESFENSNRIVAVGRETVGLRANYVLKTELREFQAEYAGPEDLGVRPPTVRVRINAKLVRVPERTIIGSLNFESLETAAGPMVDAVIPAFDEALGTVMGDIVEWTLRMGEDDWRLRAIAAS